MTAKVVAVARDGNHGFSKTSAPEIRILAGLGVEGDAHQGTKVQHLSRVAVDPNQPNLRQVHLIAAELFAELAAKGFDVAPAELGENITTQGVDLLALPKGAILHIGDSAALLVTGLRNPCAQIERFRSGLLSELVEKRADGEIVRKAGIMTVVESGGTVRPGDPIVVELPAPPFQKLERV
jgi:MOSC domain-containing protein YiiM